MTKSKVKVAVRIRPQSADKASSMLSVPSGSNQITISVNNNNNSTKSFTFDHVWDTGSTQEEVYGCGIIGEELLECAFGGYNACLFSYGQTGSGKTFTMLGGPSATSRGIIPRLCQSLFSQSQVDTQSLKIEVSYMEIYNERVRDLLTISTKPLRVREHSALGPYVDGLTLLAASSASEIESLMEEGNKSRTVAATNMNAESSRSHAVFTLIITQSVTGNGFTGEKVSRISLVDLAGSERANKTGAVGERLKEGSNINKSLTTLGLVISKLADNSEGSSFIPYRDSVLTWLLKENLGGNSRTVMIATVSPCPSNYEETLSTLRYADRAKRIVNNAVVNEDPNAKLIRELQEEVRLLKEMLKGQVHEIQGEDVNERLSTSERLMRQVSESWEEKVQRSEAVVRENMKGLEKMGISVGERGIKVDQDRVYLVNLNADPALNELLVYYLNQHNVVGRPETNPDIQLSGLGIEPVHCTLTVEQNTNTLYMDPIGCTYVNGERIHKKRALGHGDRILWGNHHFFRVNSPAGAGPATTTASTPQANPHAPPNITYELAAAELKQFTPIDEAVARLESKHARDKEVALEKQRVDLERQFNALINVVSPTTPFPTTAKKTIPGPLDRIGEGLKLLKECLLEGNKLVREGSQMALEMGLGVEYSVVLLIPPVNLTPNRATRAAGAGAVLVTSPSIKSSLPGFQPQICSMENFKNRLADMREAYQDWKAHAESSLQLQLPPFFDPEQPPHVLVGIANVFLQVLFYDDVTLNYPIPVINQQGEIVARLQVEVAKVSTSRLAPGQDVTIKVTLRHLAGIDPNLSVFCQYIFCDHLIVSQPTSCTSVIRFDDTKYFTVPVSEEFIDYAEESALSIEVWGSSEQEQAKEDRLGVGVTDRWKEVTSQLRLWVEVQELNENGDYSPVPIEGDPSTTGGVHALRQGLQRRILITLETNASIGQLPIVVDEIDQVSLGAITPRSVTLQRPLDSYQEGDLALVRARWGEALRRRRIYLDSLLQELARKEKKTDEEETREKSLVAQWISLTEERNVVLLPAPDSGVPGAPSHSNFKPEPGMEEHTPVLFLDIEEEVLSSSSGSPAMHSHTAGLDSLLPKEHDAVFVPLPMIRKSYGDFYSAWSDQRMSTESWALVSWDSSVHDCPHLNRPTPPGEVVYAILRVAVRLSHPVQMDCVLRKRICMAIKRNRPSITERLRSRFFRPSPVEDSLQPHRRTGITYQIVSHLPKSSEQLETRESLAELAVSHGESYIEEYLRCISAVDSILNLDRMRQSVYLREEQLKTRPNKLKEGPMRKTLSVPNISQLFTPPQQQPSAHGSAGGLGGAGSRLMRTSESLANLAAVTRPSSLVIGAGSNSANNASVATGPGKWSSLMSNIPEVEESSGYGSQKSNDESPRAGGENVNHNSTTNSNSTTG